MVARADRRAAPIESASNDATACDNQFTAGAFTGAQANAYVKQEANALANSVGQLQVAGARYIVVSNDYTNTGPVGNASAPLGTTGGDIRKALYIQTMWSDLVANGVQFIPADTVSMQKAIFTNPGMFGFTSILNTDTAGGTACINPNPALISDLWALYSTPALLIAKCSSDVLLCRQRAPERCSPENRSRLRLQPHRCAERDFLSRRGAGKDLHDGGQHDLQPDLSFTRTDSLGHLSRLGERRCIQSPDQQQQSRLPGRSGRPGLGHRRLRLSLVVELARRRSILGWHDPADIQPWWRLQAAGRFCERVRRLSQRPVLGQYDRDRRLAARRHQPPGTARHYGAA